MDPTVSIKYQNLTNVAFKDLYQSEQFVDKIFIITKENTVQDNLLEEIRHDVKNVTATIRESV